MWGIRKGYNGDGYFCPPILRMKGSNVAAPDGVGMRLGCRPSRHAIRRTTPEHHPVKASLFPGQIQMLGLSYDWEREIRTTDPEYTGGRIFFNLQQLLLIRSTRRPGRLGI